MLTYLLVRLADAYSMIIFIYVMMSWLPNTPKRHHRRHLPRSGQAVRPVFELVPKIDSAPWRNGGRDSHHRSACITIRGTFAGDDFLNSDGRHSDVSAT